MLLQFPAYFDSSLTGLLGLFFIVAFLYSSVGFGGGSSYLALLAIFGVAYDELRMTALLCNVIVVLGSVILYHRKGLYRNAKMLSLIGLSVPFAFLGGRMKLEVTIFYILLGVTLILAALFMSLPTKSIQSTSNKKSHWLNSIIGGLIGFLSGLVGIGGGIFLSPYLNLSKYDSALRVAAFSGLFILVNSIAGILGQLSKGGVLPDYTLMVPLLLAVLIGGQLGVRFGVKSLSPVWLKRVTAILIAIVGVRVLWEHLA